MFSPSWYKAFSLKILKLSYFFMSFLVFSVVFCLLIFSMKVNSAFSWNLWFSLLKYLQANIDFSNFSPFLWLFGRVLKVVSLFSNLLKWTFFQLNDETRHWREYIRFLLLHVRSWKTSKTWFVLYLLNMFVCFTTTKIV